MDQPNEAEMLAHQEEINKILEANPYVGQFKLYAEKRASTPDAVGALMQSPSFAYEFDAKCQWVQHLLRMSGRKVSMAEAAVAINSRSDMCHDKAFKEKTFDGFMHFIVANSENPDELNSLMTSWVAQDRSLVELDSHGLTPIQTAVYVNNVTSFAALAGKNVDVTAIDKDGLSLLHVIVVNISKESSDISLLNLWLENKLPTDMISSEAAGVNAGKTALQYAELLGAAEAARVLREDGEATFLTKLLKIAKDEEKPLIQALYPKIDPKSCDELIKDPVATEGVLKIFAENKLLQQIKYLLTKGVKTTAEFDEIIAEKGLTEEVEKCKKVGDIIAEINEEKEIMQFLREQVAKGKTAEGLTYNGKELSKKYMDHFEVFKDLYENHPDNFAELCKDSKVEFVRPVEDHKSILMKSYYKIIDSNPAMKSACENDKNKILLHYLIENYAQIPPGVFAQFLDDKELKINANIIMDGKTALQICVENGYNDWALALVKKGVGSSSLDNGVTVLNYCVSANNQTLLAMIQGEANLDITNFAVSSQKYNISSDSALPLTALLQAVIEGNIDMVVRLAKLGAGTTTLDNTNHVLNYVVNLGGDKKIAMIKALGEAEINVSDEKAEGALVTALINPEIDESLVKELMNAGVSTQGALKLFAEHGLLPPIECLLNNGAQTTSEFNKIIEKKGLTKEVEKYKSDAPISDKKTASDAHKDKLKFLLEKVLENCSLEDLPKTYKGTEFTPKEIKHFELYTKSRENSPKMFAATCKRYGVELPTKDQTEEHKTTPAEIESPASASTAILAPIPEDLAVHVAGDLGESDAVI